MKPIIPKIVFTVMVAIVGQLGANAQYYSSGEAPASVQWQQINTPHFKIVFPSFYAAEAQKLAAIMDSSIYYTSVSMGRMPQKLNVLVHAQSAYSNGFVSWAPKRMELYPTPPQDGNTQDWIQHLAIHEQRHLVQIDQLNKGFTKWMTYLFGQQATGAMIGIHYPMWLLEGDAVLTETLLTESGRGRMPWFSMPLKAQLLEKGKYNYDKAYLGSYRNYVPNYYVMGYHFVTGARQYYGHDIWGKVTSNVVPNAWYPFQFSRQIKKYSGYNKTGLYKAVYDSLQSTWENEEIQSTTTPYLPITSPDKCFKNYLYAQPNQHGTWVAEVNGPGEVHRFVEILPNKQERTITIPGNKNDEPFSFHAGRMVWSEQMEHLRWSNASTSVIRIYDFKTRRTRTVGPRHQRLFSPALSPDGTKVVAVKIDEKGHSSLLFFDVETNQTLRQIDALQGLAINPKWMDDGRHIALIIQDMRGKRIVTMNLQNRDTVCIYEPSLNDIRHLQPHGNELLVSKSENGTENIFKINLSDHSLTQLTKERFGAASPYVLGDSLYYSRYTSDGYQLAKTAEQPVGIIHNQPTLPLFSGLEKWEKGKPSVEDIDTAAYKTKPYSKWNLLNFHSWAPAYIDLSSDGITNGVSVMSQNLLNTFFVQAGYNADPNFQHEKYNLKLSYKGFFPVLGLTFKAGDEDIESEGYFYNSVDTFYRSIDATRYYYQLLPSINIPFNFSSGAWSRIVSPTARYMFYKRTGFDYLYAPIYQQNGQYYRGPIETLTEPSVTTHAMEYDLFAYQLRRGTQRDVATRWGQVFELNYRSSLFGDVDRGTQLAVLTRLYFPGIGRHHAIQIENNVQTRTNGDVSSTNNGYEQYEHFTSIVQLPRGYQPPNATNIYSLRSQYMMPIVNPDVSIGGLMYIKRLWTSVFYDFSYTNYQSKQANTGILEEKTKSYRSIGTDLMLEWHPARFIFPVSTGWRVAYLPNENSFYNEFLVNLNMSEYISGGKR